MTTVICRFKEAGMETFRFLLWLSAATFLFAGSFSAIRGNVLGTSGYVCALGMAVILLMGADGCER